MPYGITYLTVKKNYVMWSPSKICAAPKFMWYGGKDDEGQLNIMQYAVVLVLATEYTFKLYFLLGKDVVGVMQSKPLQPLTVSTHSLAIFKHSKGNAKIGAICNQFGKKESTALYIS